MMCRVGKRNALDAKARFTETWKEIKRSGWTNIIIFAHTKNKPLQRKKKIGSHGRLAATESCPDDEDASNQSTESSSNTTINKNDTHSTAKRKKRDGGEKARGRTTPKEQNSREPSGGVSGNWVLSHNFETRLKSEPGTMTSVEHRSKRARHFLRAR